MSFDFSGVKNLVFTSSFEKAKNRTNLEYENDKKIFEKANRGCDGSYFLTNEEYKKLSEYTKQEMSQYTKFRNSCVSISQSLS